MGAGWDEMGWVGGQGVWGIVQWVYADEEGAPF